MFDHITNVTAVTKRPRKPLVKKKGGRTLGKTLPKRQRKRKKAVRLGDKLLTIRTKLGFSQGEMLRRLGLEELERNYISKYERGVMEPPLPSLLEYARMANVWVDVLIDDRLDLPARLPCAKKHEGVRRRR